MTPSPPLSVSYSSLTTHVHSITLTCSFTLTLTSITEGKSELFVFSQQNNGLNATRTSIWILTSSFSPSPFRPQLVAAPPKDWSAPTHTQDRQPCYTTPSPSHSPSKPLVQQEKMTRLGTAH